MRALREPAREKAVRRAVSQSRVLAPAAHLSLQRRAGNAAIARMGSTSVTVLQRMLIVNGVPCSVDDAMRGLIQGKHLTDVRHANAIERALEMLERPPAFSSLQALLEAAQAKLDEPEPRARRQPVEPAGPRPRVPPEPDEDPFQERAHRQRDAEHARRELRSARGRRRDAKTKLGEQPVEPPSFDEGVRAEIADNEVVLVVALREPMPASRRLRFSLARHHPRCLQRGGKQRNSVFHHSVSEQQVLADCMRFGARLKSSLERDRSATSFIAGGINKRTYKADIEGAGTSLNHFYVVGGENVESLTAVETNAVLTLLQQDESQWRGAWGRAPKLTVERMSALTGMTSKQLKPFAPARRGG